MTRSIGKLQYCKVGLHPRISDPAMSWARQSGRHKKKKTFAALPPTFPVSERGFNKAARRIQPFDWLTANLISDHRNSLQFYSLKLRMDNASRPFVAAYIDNACPLISTCQALIQGKTIHEFTKCPYQEILRKRSTNLLLNPFCPFDSGRTWFQ